MSSLTNRLSPKDVQTLCTCRACRHNRKCHTQKFGQISVHTPRGGGTPFRIAGMVQPPQQVTFKQITVMASDRHLALGGTPLELQGSEEVQLPRCVGFNEIHRSLRWPQTAIWHSLFRSDPSLGEVLHENWFNLYFDPQLLGSWVVMNIINGIA